MSDDSEQLAVLGLEPVFTAQDAAVLLERSYSWLDKHVRHADFARSDGTVVEPLRTEAGYRLFTLPMLRDIVFCCYRKSWYSFVELQSTLRRLARAAE